MTLEQSKWIYGNYFYSDGIYFYDNKNSYLVDYNGLIKQTKKLKSNVKLDLDVDPLETQCCISSFGSFRIIQKNLYQFKESCIDLIFENVVPEQPEFQTILNDKMFLWGGNIIYTIDLLGQITKQQKLTDVLYLGANAKFVYVVHSKKIINYTDNEIIEEDNFSNVKSLGYMFMIKRDKTLYLMAPLIQFQFVYQLKQYFTLDQIHLGQLGFKINSEYLPTNYPDSRYSVFMAFQRKQLNLVKQVVNTEKFTPKQKPPPKQQEQLQISESQKSIVDQKRQKVTKQPNKQEPVQKKIIDDDDRIPLQKLKEVTQQVAYQKNTFIDNNDALNKYQSSYSRRLGLLEQTPQFTSNPPNKDILEVNVLLLEKAIALLEKICNKIGVD